MKLLYEWGIPSAGFLIWIVFCLVIVPVFMRYLRRKADQTQGVFDKVLSSVLGTPLILLTLALGLKLFIDAIPPAPAKWGKYTDAVVLILFALIFFAKIHQFTYSSPIFLW